MSRRSLSIAVLALCLASICAIGAASASGAGLTAVVCTAAPGGAGTGKYETDHCKTPQVSKGNYETVQVAKDTTTEAEWISVGPNEERTAPSTMSVTISGSSLNVTCETMESKSGDVTNVIAGGEMKVHGTNIVFHYSECHASLVAKPETKCEIESVSGMPGTPNTIQTEPLTTTTGTEHNLTVQPTEGLNLLSFKILKGPCLAATTEVQVTGSVNAVANTNTHSHLTFEAATNGLNLKANGKAATYTGTIASYMKGTEETIGVETF
jgi:hypothetical protein